MHLVLSTHARDFHPLDCVHAGRTTEKTPAPVVDARGSIF